MHVGLDRGLDFGWYVACCVVVLLRVLRGSKNSGSVLAKIGTQDANTFTISVMYPTIEHQLYLYKALNYPVLIYYSSFGLCSHNSYKQVSKHIRGR